MASPKASGRMINRSISESENFASLSPVAAVLFAMLIPHFNAHGKMAAGPGLIKDEVANLIPYLSYENIPEFLQEISDKTNVKWFKQGNKYWLHSINFNSEHQHLDSTKMGTDTLPSYPAVMESDSSLGVVPDSPSRAEGFKVEGFKVEEEQQQQQHAGEQLKSVVEKHEDDLVRLFPAVDLPVAVEKLLHHFRESPLLVDPWMTALKWFQREFKAPTSTARASPVSTREQQTQDILAANTAACHDFCREG